MYQIGSCREKSTYIPFFHLIKHSLDPEKFALKDGGNSRSWVNMSIFLRLVVGTREKAYETGKCWRLCSLEVDTEDSFGCKMFVVKRQGEKAVLGREGIELWVRPDKALASLLRSCGEVRPAGLGLWRQAVLGRRHPQEQSSAHGTEPEGADSRKALAAHLSTSLSLKEIRVLQRPDPHETAEAYNRSFEEAVKRCCVPVD